MASANTTTHLSRRSILRAGAATGAAALLASGATAALATSSAAGRTDGHDQIEPTAGTWRTWVLANGAQLRPAPPPSQQTARAEVQELATLAKRLDKIEHTRKDVVVAHKEALDREARAQAIIAKFEEGVKADTKAARAKAADLQAQIDAATKERTALAATLPADVLTDYERLLKQFRGLAVETIQGNIPTVCHTALQASSMSDLNHDGSEITHCPYCHRLLVLPSKEA